MKSEASLPLISALVSETLRLVPPLSPHIRVAKGNTNKNFISLLKSFVELKEEVEIEGVKFKPGDNFEVPIDLLHRHPSYWSRPDEFYPERFIESPDLIKSWFYMPFGAGPRNCIGTFLKSLYYIISSVRNEKPKRV